MRRRTDHPGRTIVVLQTLPSMIALNLENGKRVVPHFSLAFFFWFLKINSEANQDVSTTRAIRRGEDVIDSVNPPAFPKRSMKVNYDESCLFN